MPCCAGRPWAPTYSTYTNIFTGQIQAPPLATIPPMAVTPTEGQWVLTDFKNCSQMAWITWQRAQDFDLIWGMWRLGLHLELIVTFLGSFMSSFCVGMAQSPAWEGHCHQTVPMPWGGVFGLQPSLGGWCLSSGINTNDRTQGFPEEHCLVARWPMLFIRTMLWLIGVCTAMSIHFHSNAPEDVCVSWNCANIGGFLLPLLAVHVCHGTNIKALQTCPGWAKLQVSRNWYLKGLCGAF